MDESTDPDSPEAQSLRDRVTRCFQILENAGLCIHKGSNVYSLHPALRGCLARMYPASDDVKRWFVRFLTYIEEKVHNDVVQRVGLFSYYEANFFHAMTLTEELNMCGEDLQLTWGLANYAHDRSRTALAEKRYKEMAEKACRYVDFDMQDRAYTILATLATDPECKRFWTQKAADVWSGAEELSADAYFTLGHNAERQGNLSAAVEHYKQALTIWEREEDSRAVALYGKFGTLAQQQGDAESAKQWYQKYCQKAKDLGDTKSQAIASLALGSIAAEQGDVVEALKRYQEALEIFQALQDQRNIADTLNNTGELFMNLGAYDLAKEKLIQSVRIAERIGNTFLAAANYNALGKLSEAQGDFTSVKLWFAKALSMSEAMGDEENATVARSNLEEVTANEAAQHQKEEST